MSPTSLRMSSHVSWALQNRLKINEIRLLGLQILSENPFLPLFRLKLYHHGLILAAGQKEQDQG
jgi:hypothetical protein